MDDSTLSRRERSSRSGDDGDRDPSRPLWHTEGLPEGATPAPRGKRPRQRAGKWFWVAVVVLVLVNWILAARLLAPEPRLTVPYTRFLTEISAGNVESVTSRGSAIQANLAKPIEVDGRTDDHIRTERPAYADDDLLAQLRKADVVVSAKPLDSPRPLWQIAVFSFGPSLLLIGLLLLMLQRFSGGIGRLGKSKARRYDADASRTTFADVAGIDEARGELTEIVDMLRDPEKYRRIGAVMPKGVLLSGRPGTGKTLLARALAGEAHVPFFSASASEFVEMVVGVGASRVRDLYEQAKKVAPAIVFIDEIDAIGRARGGAFGGVDEREQTLNQILTEMDGFTGAEGVITVAATNRPDVLDPALLRPGRFDRRVVVNPPDQIGRRQILEIHTRGVRLDEGVDLDALASKTPGMTGADLRNLVNEGALLAARRGHVEIRAEDLADAVERVILGTERNIVIDEDERRRTAYHESGHALLGMVVSGADPVRKISIIPRGMALGVTLQTPDRDRYGYSTQHLRARIVGLLGGRAAEQLVFESVTTGAESDLEQVTAIARLMIGRWGMSDAIGLVAVLPDPDAGALPPGDPRLPSEHTRRLVDEEVRRLVDECFADACGLLESHRAQLDALALALLERETLDEADAYAIAGIEAPDPSEA